MPPLEIPQYRPPQEGLWKPLFGSPFWRGPGSSWEPAPYEEDQIDPCSEPSQPEGLQKGVQMEALLEGFWGSSRGLNHIDRL